MRCGNCDKTDGICYTSNPPQVKCTITGEFHRYEDECDAVLTGKLAHPKHPICCEICNDLIEESDYPQYSIRICDNCKAAVMAVRRQLDI